MTTTINGSSIVSIISIVFLLIVLFVIVYTGSKRHRSRKQILTHGRTKPTIRNKMPPTNMGLRPNIPLVKMSTCMEEAFSRFFGQEFKDRVLFKYPEMKSADYEWNLFEIKRYFMLCSLLNEVPMFSEEIDHIWHEMLLYSREYQQFCEAFAGRIIHHSPHATPKPMPNERAWFDWVYCQLFYVTPYSSYIWKGFFQHPLSPEQLQPFETETTPQLASMLFHPVNDEQDPGRQQTIRILILKMKEQIQNAKASRAAKTVPNNPQHLQDLTVAFVYFSLFGRDDYSNNMSIMLNKYSKYTSPSSSDSGCSFDSEFGGSHHHGGHHGGTHHHGGGGHGGGGHGSCSGHSGCGGSSGCGSSCGGGQ